LSSAKLRIFVVFAIVAAAVCIRLGFWQMSRLHERQARNALVKSRIDSAEVDFRSLPRDTAQSRFRRARVVGTPDYAHELIYAARTHRGSPGVNFLTPVKIVGTDTVVLVNRGWLYAPDGATVDSLKWRENDSTFSGYVEAFPAAPGAAYATRPNVLSRLGLPVVEKILPYPVAPMYLVEVGDSTMANDRIARLTVPPLDEGPHLSYAIQWFSFALVALAGAGFVVRQARAERAGSVSTRDRP
jgi:surfeit locus 1 family protein